MTTIGQVTNRKHARYHLIQDGRAVCPVVRGRHAIREPRPVTVDTAPLVCKRCRPALHAAALAAEIDANQQSGIGTVINGRWKAERAAALTIALESTADRARREKADAEFRAKFDAIVAANLTDLIAA